MSLHPAKKEAIQLFKVWSHGRIGDECFPVDCCAIATELGIRVEPCDVGDDFQGCLLIDGSLKAILYNDSLPEVGRQNFTIGHELGHYCLHRDRKEIRCSAEDIENFGGAPHGDDIEREANIFASNLLMPASDIRQQAAAAKTCNLDLTVKLASRYHTSLTATACRLVEVSTKPCAVVMVSNKNRILWGWGNTHFHKFFAAKGADLNPLQHSYEGLRLTRGDQPVLCPENWEITLSAVPLKSYGKTLLLVQGESFEHTSEQDPEIWTGF
tara:strand:- start:779 stop:1585 length:807 start_codon:yes stop_codon:yes gene_type:complete